MNASNYLKALFGSLVMVPVFAFVSTVHAQPGFHVRADAGVTLNGDNVSTWADQSGNGRDAVQAAAMQPQTSVKTAGSIETAEQLVSTKATGAPLAVSSEDVVSKLNADMLDGSHSTAFADAAATAAEIVVLQSQINSSASTHRSQLLCQQGAIRYLDLGDGTVWDCKQKLQWLKDADCLGPASWDNANGSVLDAFNAGTTGSNCDDLAQGSYNDWRLATKSEWEAALADGNSLFPECSSPALTSNGGARQVDDWPTDQDIDEWVGTCASTGPFAFGVVQQIYWSSTSSATISGNAWTALLGNGNLQSVDKTFPYFVWPVRGGQ